MTKKFDSNKVYGLFDTVVLLCKGNWYISDVCPTESNRASEALVNERMAALATYSLHALALTSTYALFETGKQENSGRPNSRHVPKISLLLICCASVFHHQGYF